MVLVKKTKFEAPSWLSHGHRLHTFHDACTNIHNRHPSSLNFLLHYRICNLWQGQLNVTQNVNIQKVRILACSSLRHVDEKLQASNPRVSHLWRAGHQIQTLVLVHDGKTTLFVAFGDPLGRRQLVERVRTPAGPYFIHDFEVH